MDPRKNIYKWQSILILSSYLALFFINSIHFHRINIVSKSNFSFNENNSKIQLHNFQSCVIHYYFNQVHNASIKKSNLSFQNTNCSNPLHLNKQNLSYLGFSGSNYILRAPPKLYF